jgi:hypothetical protein
MDTGPGPWASVPGPLRSATRSRTAGFLPVSEEDRHDACAEEIRNAKSEIRNEFQRPDTEIPNTQAEVL